MANKKIKNQKPVKSNENRDAARRTRTLRIVVTVFSILLVLSMILSLTTN